MAQGIGFLMLTWETWTAALAPGSGPGSVPAPAAVGVQGGNQQMGAVCISNTENKQTTKKKFKNGCFLF